MSRRVTAVQRTHLIAGIATVLSLAAPVLTGQLLRDRFVTRCGMGRCGMARMDGPGEGDPV